MKIVSWIAAIVGILVVLIAFYTRFHGERQVSLMGNHCAAGSLLLVGNTILILGILFAVLDLQDKKQ